MNIDYNKKEVLLMKKTIKLIFGLFLTLVLAACNLSPSTTTSSLTGSSSNTISGNPAININSITLTADGSLVQFLGLTSRVNITANIDGSNTQGISLEWYVDNVKSLTQTGRVFEFLPTSPNKFIIYAKYNNVQSNSVEINVSLPQFNLTRVDAKSSNQIEIKADQGITFSINGLTIGNTSSYNLANQTYTLNLLTSMVQGTTYTIVASKAGFNSLSYPFVYETRRVSLSNLVYLNKKVEVGIDGTYQLQKPFTGSPSQNYTLSIATSNLEGTNVPFSIITNVPANATAIAAIQTTQTITRGVNINQDFTLSSATEPGLYVHNISVNNVNLIVRVSISNATPAIALTTPIVYDDPIVNGNTYTPMLNPFGLDAEGDYIKNILKAESNGSFTITRPYNGPAKEISFIIRADNFPTPLGFPPAPSAPYNIIAGLTGPTGGVMYYGQTVNNLAAIFPFRETTGNSYKITQFVDNKTALGTYTYTFTATGAGINLTRTIVIVVREFAPTIEPIIKINNVDVKPNSDGSYTLFKPLANNSISTTINAKISNYESPLAATTSGGTGLTTLYNDGTSLRFLLDYKVTYSGPLSGIAPLDTKLGVELGAQSENNKPAPSQTSPVVNYTSYFNLGNFVTINLNSIRDQDVYATTNVFSNIANLTTNSFPGTHTYSIQLGGISKVIVFRIVEPTPLIVLRDDVVQYGPTSGSASEANVTLNKTDGRYYVDGKNGFLKINVNPFGMITGSYPYTFTRLTPSGSFQSTTNIVALTLVTGQSYDGTLTIPGSPAIGSEMKVNEQLLEEGLYKFTFNINNQFVEINVVVLPEPQLKVDSITLGTEELIKFNDIYFTNHSAVARFLEINISPVNIEETYKYVINNTGAFPTGSALEAAKQDLVLIDGKMTIGITLPARTSPTVPETNNYLIALYKGTVRVGAVTKVIITSQPFNSTIFFNTNGGTALLPITGFVDTTAALPSNPTRTGFTFDGWFVDPTLLSPYVGTNFPALDLILYAKWLQV